MDTALAPRTRPLARRIGPPERRHTPGGNRPANPSPQAVMPRRRELRPRPTKGPGGEVRWWERPAPGGDQAMWSAVCRLQAHRIERRVSVCEVVRRLAGIAHPVSRETLSRVLNGKQPTSWETVHALEEVLGVPIARARP